MKHLILLGGIGVLAAVGWFLFSDTNVPAPDTPAPEAVFPVIEVVRGDVTVTKDGESRPAVSGEALGAPFSLESGPDGLGIVKLGDGSELRLDRDSSLAVSEATYDANIGGLSVRAKLAAGRVWSSIIALATPESSWEVETSNVVGTVRGTAFGMEAFANGDTKVTGSEHSLTLTIIDPGTGERDPSRTFSLAEDEFVIISDSVARDRAAEVPKPEKRTERESRDAWVLENEGRDRERGLNQRLPIDIPVSAENVDPASDGVPAVSAPVTPSTATPTRPEPTSIRVTPSVPLAGIVEGTPVTLSATLTFSDGTTREVSREASWRVIGDIGSVTGNRFTPRLAPNVSELGRALGSVSVSWKDTATGKELSGATEIFEVKAKVVPLGTQEG